MRVWFWNRVSSDLSLTDEAERARGIAMGSDPRNGETNKKETLGFICFFDKALLLFGLSSSPLVLDLHLLFPLFLLLFLYQPQSRGWPRSLGGP